MSPHFTSVKYIITIHQSARMFDVERKSYLADGRVCVIHEREGAASDAEKHAEGLDE